MLFLVAVQTRDRETVEIFERVRRAQDIKLETVAAWLGWSRTRLQQFYQGQTDLRWSQLMALTREADSKAFLEAFLQEVAVVKGIRHWDGVVAGLLRFAESVDRGCRMAKAELRPAEHERRTA